MIDHNHPDNVLASCSREMLKLLGMIDEKSQKRSERQECVTDGQMYSQPGDSIESTLLWQRRLKKRMNIMGSFPKAESPSVKYFISLNLSKLHHENFPSNNLSECKSDNLFLIYM